MKRIFTIFMMVYVLLSANGQSSTIAKLSPWLQQALIESRQNQRRAGDVQQEENPQVVTFVQFDREVSDEELAAYQCRRYAQLDDIAIVMLPLSKLDDFSKLTSVLHLEANQRAHPTMDTVPKVIDLVPVYEQTVQHAAYTGRGVIVGLMDVGFDLTHPNFYQDATLSQYRIGAFWDQLAVHDDDVLPVGKSYTTQEDILAKACSTDSPIQGHGTHTLGIAAGNGYDTAYRGVAFESDICLVSNAVTSDTLYIDKLNYYRYTSATDALGFKYIFDYAEQQQKPCVVSFSEGYAPYIDQDDSLFAAFIGKMTGPGRIFVSSAGNENVEMTYAEKPIGTEAAGAFVRAYKKDVLYRFKADGDLDIHLAIYDKATGKHQETLVLSMAGMATDSIRNDTIAIGEQQLTTVLMRYASSANPNDTIYLLSMSAGVTFDELANIAMVMVGKDCHAALYGTSSYALRNNTGLDKRCYAAVYGHNILAPGCFPASICVGATQHRVSYTNVAGKRVDTKGSGDGLLGYYSSTGPALNEMSKPDISAPGSNVLSSYNSFYQEAHSTATSNIVAFSEIGGRKYPWTVDTGTSMSTPVVAGTIALWLQAKPTLTRDEIMGVLSRTSRHPEESLTYPNDLYGYGEINAYRGLLDVLGLTAIETISQHTTSAQVSVSDGQLRLHFSSALHHPVMVSLYTMSGQLCGQMQLAPGQQEYKMPLTDTASGIYAIQLTGKDSGVTGSQLVRL